MSLTNVQNRSNNFKQRRFFIDHHYTADELEWNRIVGPSGIGTRLLREMASLSVGIFNLDDVERIPMSDGERFEFKVADSPHTIHFDYEVSPTSTLLKGLRHLFVEVNSALRRAGVDWRYVLTRENGASRSFDYKLVLAPRSEAVEKLGEYDVVAGIDLKEYELDR